jgi:hypothetical protein
MLARGRGRIINVTSGIGGVPGPGLSGYVISKAALMRLTDSLAAEVAGKWRGRLRRQPGCGPHADERPPAREPGGGALVSVVSEDVPGGAGRAA